MTAGAIAGNELGVWKGYASRPKPFGKPLELRDVIEEIATDLATGRPETTKEEASKRRKEKYIAAKRG